MKPPRASTTATVLQHLQRDASAERLLPTAMRLLDIERLVKEILPSTFRAHVGVCQFNDGELVLTVQSAALASKLKQALPRIRDGITTRGWKVTSIALTVQPPSSTYKSGSYPDKANPGGIPERGLDAWRKTLEAMPESELSQAIQKLLIHHKRSS